MEERRRFAATTIKSGIQAVHSYMWKNGRWMSLLTISVLLSTVIAALSVYKGKETTNSVAAWVAGLSVLASNAGTYYNSVKERLTKAEVCKATLMKMQVQLSQSNWDAEAWSGECAELFEKYPQVLGSLQAAWNELPAFGKDLPMAGRSPDATARSVISVQSEEIAKNPVLEKS